MSNITKGTVSCVQLVGVTGDGIQSKILGVTFPVLPVTNELYLYVFYVIDTRNSKSGSTLLAETTFGKTILSPWRFSLRSTLKLIFRWVEPTTLVLTVFCTHLRVFLFRWVSTIICIFLCGDPLVSWDLTQPCQTSDLRWRFIIITGPCILPSVTSESQRQLPLLFELPGTRVIVVLLNEFVHTHYGSLVKFLQDGTCHDDFVESISETKVLVSLIMSLNW